MFSIVSRAVLLAIFLLSSGAALGALGDSSYVAVQPQSGALELSAKRQATLYVDKQDFRGVVRALKDLQTDIKRVTGKKPSLVHRSKQLVKQAVIVGTIGKSQLIDQLISSGKIDPSGIIGKWDGYHLEVVNNPLPGVDRALIIAGADKRGTIYGIYDVSEQIGVSPWHHWADVPAKKKDQLYILGDTKIQDYPKVKYRGIFLNDEAPALTSWVKENYGNYNHEFYETVFELILRLKGNFLWPAMWNNAFSDDDPQNMILADEYGIVMSNSHHEPMMRADKEWNRHGEGKWDYSVNAKNLYQFWQDGAKRNKPYESLFTLGMRGQQDEPMSEDENIGLLETIVADQRKILTEVFNDRDITEVPQVWTLYKEVQSYYENGMRVPDDVVLLWSDDNWGNIRRLPTPEERKRSGGAGVYYHFDYVGGPRSYRWMNVVPIAKIWEQMNLAYQYEANQVWVVNVGDLKPMEYPIEYFMRLAWSPERWPKERIQEFGQLWAAREFGEEYAKEIEALMTGYTRHNGRRKPELMAPDTYSVLNYGEANRIEAELDDLVVRAETLFKKIPKNKQDAFFQLVLHPVKAVAIVTKLNIAVAKNRLYANQGRANASDYALQAKALFAEDAALKERYHSVNGGKWKHFMNQPHIGYTNWNNPEGDQMPVVYDYTPGNYAEMGIAVEGIKAGWPEAVSGVWPHKSILKLSFDQNGKSERWFEVYNRGSQPFEFKASSAAPWLKLSKEQGKVGIKQRVMVSVDWSQLPEGSSNSVISVKGTGWQGASIKVAAFKPEAKIQAASKGFVEADGYISIEAASYDKNHSVEGFGWKKVEQLGRTLSSMSALPITDKSFKKPKKAPYLEYDVTFVSTGEFEIQTLLSPSWPIDPKRGLRYAISVGKEPPQVIDFLKGTHGTDESWEESVKDGVRLGRSTHKVKQAGPTTIRIYMIDSGVTFQKIIVDTGGLLPSYLGPEESSKRIVSGSPNLFVQLGFSKTTVLDKVDAAYQQLFYGDSKEEAVYYRSGNNENGLLAYIHDVNSDDVRSEGMSYGMMISVQLDKKEEFDAIWNWAKTYMHHTSESHPAKGFFAWSVNTTGKILDGMPAPDGEEYFATALYFAAERWGNGKGIYNYSAEADQLLKDMRHRKIITGKTVTGVKTAGNLFDPEHAMVRFTPDAMNMNHTDASYHLPAFYEVWARVGPKKDRSFWAKAATVSRNYFQKSANPKTALTPDYGEFDGSPWAAPWRMESVDFRYDAWRTAMNWSMDWAWWRVDPRAQVLSDRLQAFFESEGMDSYVNLYTLDGEKLNKGQTTALTAMNATASLAATHPRSKKFVQALWDVPIPTGHYRYYDGMLYLMAMLNCSGQYRAWLPETSQ